MKVENSDTSEITQKDIDEYIRINDLMFNKSKSKTIERKDCVSSL
jgi:hypothetical protein